MGAQVSCSETGGARERLCVPPWHPQVVVFLIWPAEEAEMGARGRGGWVRYLLNGDDAADALIRGELRHDHLATLLLLPRLS